MRIAEVDNVKTREDFLMLPRRLYKNDPNWISPLLDDISAIFDPSKNVFFQHGICKRWVLYDDNENPSVESLCSSIISKVGGIRYWLVA
jgi:hypothetical protein